MLTTWSIENFKLNVYVYTITGSVLASNDVNLSLSHRLLHVHTKVRLSGAGEFYW